MNRLQELKARIGELKLTPLEQTVAVSLICGSNLGEIAEMTGQPLARIRLCLAAVMLKLRRPKPPADAATVRSPNRPRKPHLDGAALKLP